MVRRLVLLICWTCGAQTADGLLPGWTSLRPRPRCMGQVWEGRRRAVLYLASGSAEFDGQLREREVSGFGDPRLRFSVNLYGAPALSLKEFADYRQDLIVGASLQVSVPWGSITPSGSGKSTWLRVLSLTLRGASLGPRPYHE